MTRTPILIATLIATALAAPAVLAQGQGKGNGKGQGGGAMMEFTAEWDMDGDGAVRLADMAERRLTQFDMFDLDGSGAIDAAEQANMAETIKAAMAANHEGGHGMGPGQRIHAAMTADYTDTDKDGTLTRAEWEAATQRLFTELDRNGDGVLEPVDLRPQG